MFYKYDKETLNYVKNHKWLSVFISLIIISSITSFGLGRYRRYQLLEDFEKEIIVLNIKEEKEKFTKDKLISELNRLNVKFPHIVMAQSIVETGHFTSDIFLENNNLFGMKEARVRINTASGTSKGHAYYNSWEESVYDYAFYQSRYLGKIKTEEEYFNYLSSSYAEANNYVVLLNEVIERYELREVFD